MKRPKTPVQAPGELDEDGGHLAPTSTGKKLGSKKRAKTSAWPSGTKGWKAVDVGAELLLGADESGFAGLEMLDDYTLLDASELAGAEVVSVDDEQQPVSKGQKDNKKKKTTPGESQQERPSKKHKAQAPAPSDAAALQAQLNTLKKENAALKKQVSKKDPQAANASTGKEEAGPKLSRKERKAAFLAKVIEAKAAKRSSNKSQSPGAAAGSVEAAVKPALKASEEKRSSKQPRTSKAGKVVGLAQQATVAPPVNKADSSDEPEAHVPAGQQVQDADDGPAAPSTDITAWRLFGLHPKLEDGLAVQGFSTPTDIQAAVLPAALQDQADIIGAAQTGSGKTLAFGLPIMQALLQEEEVAAAQGVPPPHAGKLRALIMAPTRELAIQVANHIQALGRVAGIRAVAIVGGLAHVKQERLLRAQPPIVVATPGRLWELLRDNAAPHLSDMSSLSFLVLDEADCLVQRGHFQELASILALVPRPGQQQGPTYDPDFLPAMEAVTQLEKEEAKRKRRASQPSASEPADMDTDEQPEEEQEVVEQEVKAASAEQSGPGRARVKSKGHLMQTLVFSATLTLPSNLRKRLRRGGGGALGGTDLETLMDKVPFRGTPRIIDLSSVRRLAQGVAESYVSCLEGTDRDTVLYYLLNRHPGRTLVFANAVSTLRRVAALLKVLGIPAHAIHAQQQQRQRLKALDHFKSNPQAVLVASDVAARGLDVRDVRMVVHYQIPASVDTYIHRSGRTGRGADAEGLSVALVAPDEAARWTALCKAMGHEQPPPAFPVDATLIPKVIERIKLASKIDDVLRVEKRRAAEDAWTQRTAQDVGLAGDGQVEDDDQDDDDALRAARLSKHKAAELTRLRSQLSALLAQPLAPRMSLSYFTGGAVAGVAVSSASGRRKQGDKEAAAAQGEAGSASAVAASSVSQAVALAGQMRSAGQAGVQKQAGSRKKLKVLSIDQLAKQELARRSAAKQARRQRGSAGLAPVAAAKNKKGLVVIPPVMSRDAQGQDALAALKRKLQALG